jgi:hypothetical protein
MPRPSAFALLCALAACGCGARTSLPVDTSAAPCRDGGVRTCAASLAGFRATFRCPLFLTGCCPLPPNSSDMGMWCSLGAVAQAGAFVKGSFTGWQTVELIQNGQGATLFYDATGRLVFVLGPDGSCLAGRVPPEAQCQTFTDVGTALCPQNYD